MAKPGGKFSESSRRDDDRRESVWLRATARDDTRAPSTPYRKERSPQRESRQPGRK